MEFEEFYDQIRQNWSNQEYDTIKHRLAQTDPTLISQLIRLLPTDEEGPIFRLLAKDLAIEVFELLNVEEQERLLYSFQADKAIEFLSQLDPDDQVQLLDELPAKVANRLLSLLSPAERQTIGILMGYPPDTAGRIMTPEFVSIRQDFTVQDAISHIRSIGIKKETIYYVYVLNNERHLQGVVSLKDLILADGTELIRDIMKTNPVYAKTRDDQEDVAKKIQEYDFLALPIVDREQRLVGIVTVDDAMDVIQEEATEDIYVKAGLGTIASSEITRSYDLVKGGVGSALRARMPYLVITMFGALLAGGVIGFFEESLEKVLILAFFIPVIMDMGGNVGTQSSTIFTRGLLLGHISMDQFVSQVTRESKVGASMGLILGSLVGLIGYLWQGKYEIGLVVGLSLFFTITLATVVGFVVPFGLRKLGLDQAAGADPIITTIKDISGLIIYFTVASMFLGALLD